MLCSVSLSVLEPGLELEGEPAQDPESVSGQVLDPEQELESASGQLLELEQGLPLASGQVDPDEPEQEEVAESESERVPDKLPLGAKLSPDDEMRAMLRGS